MKGGVGFAVTDAKNTRNEVDYVLEMNELIEKERERVIRIMQRIDASMAAIRRARRVTGNRE